LIIEEIVVIDETDAQTKNDAGVEMVKETAKAAEKKADVSGV
jgi:hypothetical protein